MKTLIIAILILFFPLPVMARSINVKYEIKSKYAVTHSNVASSALPTPASKPKSAAQRSYVKAGSDAQVSTGGSEWVISLIKKHFGPDWKLAYAIARAESGLRCGAVGDHAIAYWADNIEYGKSYGVFQIRHLQGRPEPKKLQDCEYNIMYAKQLFDRSGFYPWSAFTNDSYLAFYE